jgi:dCTP deaminase
LVLTDREIEIALSQGDIIIDPLPNMKEALSSTSIDLTLSNRFSEWKHTPGLTVRPGANGYKHSHMDHLRKTFDADTYTLKSKSFVLAWTKEYVRLPLRSKVAARVEGKSTLARLGVSVHVTAPTIHSGFKGNIQLEMFNLGCFDVILDRDMKVCQLIFEYTSGTPNKEYSGAYSGQTPTGGA